MIRVGAEALEFWDAERSSLRLVASQRLARRGSLYDAHGLVEGLGALSERSGRRRALLVLESAYVPVQLVDTGGALASTSQLDALLRHRFGLAYAGAGSDIAAWRMRTDHRFGQRLALACAVPESVGSALHEAIRTFDLRFDAWVSALAWGLDRHRPWRQWPGQRGWWAWPEQDRQLLVYVAKGRMQGLNPASQTDGSPDAIRRSLAFERARSGIDAESDPVAIGSWDGRRGEQPAIEPAEAAAR